MTGEHLAYYRKSVGRAGISRQRTATTAHVEGLGGTITREHSDTDRTAYQAPGEATPERPGFAALLADLRRTPGARIAAWHADRIFRSAEEAERLIHAVPSLGGLIIETARGGSYDLSTATGRKRLRGDVIDAQYEVDHAIERITAQQAEMRAEGRWTGGRRPFGWRVDSAAPGGLVLDDGEAELIRQALAAVLGGGTLTAVAREWNAAGAAGRQWTQLLVRQVLMRPLNASLVTLSGKVVGDGSWPAITDEGTHRAIAAYLSDPARRTGPGPEPKHLLTGIALCGECGSPLAVRGSEGIAVYRCRRNTAGLVPGSGHASRRVTPLDAYARELAIRRLKRKDAALLLRADHTADRAALLTADAAQKALHDEQWELYRAKVITPRELAQGRAEIDAARDAIRGQLAALDAADALAPFLADPEVAWEESGVRERRALVAGLMHVTVFPARRGRPAGTPRGSSWFDVSSIDVRWARRLPSDG